MTILEDLNKYFLSEIVVDPDQKALTPDSDLLGQGILDSLGLMKLVLFIETSFNITINDEEIVPDNFQCLNSIVKYIETKTQQHSAGSL